MARRKASGEATVMGLFAVIPLSEGVRLLGIARAIVDARMAAVAPDRPGVMQAKKPRVVRRKRRIAAEPEAERAIS